MNQTKAPLRCSYCHDEASGLLCCCEGCGGLLHVECRAELGRCATFGCRPRLRLRLSDARRPRSPLRPLWTWLRDLRRRPLRSLAWAIPLLLVGAGFLGASPRPSSPDPRRRARVQTQCVQAACSMFYADHRRYPASLSELTEDDHYYRASRDFPGEQHFVTLGGSVWLAERLDSDSAQPELRLLGSIYELEGR